MWAVGLELHSSLCRASLYHLEKTSEHILFIHYQSLLLLLFFTDCQIFFVICTAGLNFIPFGNLAGQKDVERAVVAAVMRREEMCYEE